MRCDYCSKDFKSVDLWRHHVIVEIANRKNMPPNCLNCSLQFSSPTALQIHLRKRSCRGSEFPKDQCVYCTKYFTAPSTLRQHLKYNVCHTTNILTKFQSKVSAWDLSKVQMIENVTMDQLNMAFVLD